MTENKKSSQSSPSSSAPKRRRRRRRPNKPKTAQAASSQGPKSAKSDQPMSKSPEAKKKNSRPNRNNKRRVQSKNGRSKPLKNHEIGEKYDNLMNLHLLARKKYFENFHKKDKKHVQKLERNFHKTALDVRAFERKLNINQKEILDKKTNGYPLDLVYSSTNPNSDDVIKVEIPSPPYSDPHVNEIQKARESFSHDTEASKGTMEEYEAYKAEQSA